MDIVTVCLLFGGLISLLSTSKGIQAFSNKIELKCKGQRSPRLLTLLLGILIFIDDYLNIITLSACMKPVTDKKKIPREALAYVIDSTGAPVCVLLPFSTWAIFYASVFFEQTEIQALGYKNGIQTYLHIIPFTVYAIIALIIVFLFCLGLLPKLGLMKKAYHQMENSKSYSCESTVDKLYVEDHNPRSTGLDFLLPILVLIVITIISGDMLLALFITLFVCFILYIPRRILSFADFCNSFMEGIKSMVPTLCIVFAAFMMQEAAESIHLADYVINLVSPYMNRALYPAIVFFIVSFLTFVTGSNWGIPAVCIPLLIPLGSSIGTDLILVMGAILSGGTFGSHACFYSDATCLTSSSCELNNMDHSLSQFPYAMISAGITFIAYVILGFLYT